MAPHMLTKLKINRVAAVDRGAGEGVRIVLMKRNDPANIYVNVNSISPNLPAEVEAYLKREFTAEQRQAAEDKGHAMSGGGFPIESVQDLKNAIQAIGRAKDPAAAKAHIIRRARALGQSDLIPEGWSKRHPLETITNIAQHALSVGIKRDIVTKALKAASACLRSIQDDDAVTDKQAMIEKNIAEFRSYLAAQGDSSMTPAELREAIDAKVQKGIEDAVKTLNATIAKQAQEIALFKMSAEHKAYHSAMPNETDAHKEARAKFADMSPEDRDAHMDKHPMKKGVSKLSPEIQEVLGPVLKTNETLTRQVADLTKSNREMTELQEIAEFKKRAIATGLPESHGEVMRKAYRGDAEAIKAHEAALKGLVEQAKTGKLFGEFGKSGGDGPTSAYDTLMAKAEARMAKSEKRMSKQQAFTAEYVDPENRPLVEQYNREKWQHRAA